MSTADSLIESYHRSKVLEIETQLAELRKRNDAITAILQRAKDNLANAAYFIESARGELAKFNSPLCNNTNTSTNLPPATTTV